MYADTQLHLSALSRRYTTIAYARVVETSEKSTNHCLRELKDLIASRKSTVDRCSLEKEYIIPADIPFPSQRQQDALPKAKKKF